MSTGRSSIGTMFGATPVATFMGLPTQSPAALTADIALIGAPCATPYASVGAYCAGAPAAIRSAMAAYAPALAHYDFDFDGPFLGSGRTRVADCGDIAWTESDAAGNRAAICSTIATILDRDAVPVVIGGDDSVPIPIFTAFAGRGKFTVVQIDAHLDWREEVGGERLGLSSTMRRASEMDHIERIVQIGQRGLGSARPNDYQAAIAAGVAFVPAREVHTRGVHSILDRIPSGARVLLTVDCDALDPAIMPAVIAPAPGGLTYWQTIDVMHGIAAKAQIACFDLVEFMPERDAAQLGAAHAGRILIHAIGLIARQFNTRLA
jgi:agmatinase